MERSIEGGRWTVTFRPRRLVRIFGTGFLALWLCGWVVGETFGLGILLVTLDVRGGSDMLGVLATLADSLAPGLLDRFTWRVVPGPQNAGVLALSFLGSWLAFWTMAGLMASYQMMRLLSSADLVAWDGAGIELFRRTGPFRAHRSWDADKIEHVSLSRSDRALLLHTSRATHVLTPWGSKAERQAVRDEIRMVLEGPAREVAYAAVQDGPPGWSVSPAAEGGLLLVRDPADRRGRVLTAWSATIALAAGAAIAYGEGRLGGSWGVAEGAGALVVLLVIGAAAAASAWLTFGGSEIVVRRGAIEFRRGFIAGGSGQVLRPVEFSVEHTTDSDGDDWFELQARSGDEHRTIDLRMNESENVLKLARWIAERSGAPLHLGRGVEEDEEPKALAA